jgi:two-component system sensor histidine kinase GlrK
LFRPRSIARLILFGFAVVLAPFVAAIVTAIVQVDRLAQNNRLAVLEVSIATEQSRSLVEQLTEMQRALGQYEVRGDRDFYEIYLERREILQNALENLIEIDLDELAGDELTKLQDDELALFQRIGGEAGGLEAGMTWADAAQQLAELGFRGRAVLAQSNRLVERQANLAIASAEDMQRNLLLLTAAAVPATILLAGLFIVLISRPMRALGRAITQLGARQLETPIEVHGPQDVEELGRQLDWLRRRIHDLEEQKVGFLRHISHELKTPLTTLREGSELLVESLADGSPEEAEISRLMRTNSLHLQHLIEDLLQFAHTQEPTTDLNLATDVDLAALARVVVATQSVASGSKDIEIALKLQPASVRGDENKIRVIIDNLLTNAIKYTPTAGHITLSLKVHDGYAIVDVTDTGPGIDDDEIESIFEPFQQGKAEYQSSVKGTGLGLAIAKEYVEAHNGTIKVIASEGGAHFRVALPMDRPASIA